MPKIVLQYVQKVLGLVTWEEGMQIVGRRDADRGDGSWTMVDLVDDVGVRWADGTGDG
jgi:hypothetical protein